MFSRGPRFLVWDFVRLLCVLSLSAVAFAAEPARGRTTPLPPAEALASFQVDAGLRIELVAAEPLVVSPVAMAFDERGRLYVVENRGYPDPIDPKAPGTREGRIALLEDTDGDGRFDKRTEFARDLSYPNGIVCWRGGVFVTCAPDIYFLKDNNGDGVADERRVVLTGFDTSRSGQLRVSSPVLGLDGKIHVAGGLTGGNVTSPLHPERAAVKFSPADGRFDPDTFVFEVTGGHGQFGLTFDGFGRRFYSSNRHPIMQAVLEPWQLARNPHLAFAQTVQEVSKVEAAAAVHPVSGASVTADFIPNLMAAPHTGTFTSACAVFVFGGAGLPEAYRGNAFVCEPAQNLVQRQVLRAEGASFRADAAPGEREFLASTDTWFRPVWLASGPDGALYVADMHRREIDHPVYVPEEARGKLDFESGKGAGRIYRVVSATAPRAAKRDSVTSPAVLVAELDSSDAWRREAAFRLLLEKRDAAQIAALEKSVTAAARPEARVRALALLSAGKNLSEEKLLAALGDSSPGVRENALNIAAERAAKSAALRERVLALAGDGDARVRFACALALAADDDARAVGALATIAARDAADRWTRAAVLSGVGARIDAFSAALQGQKSGDAVGRAALQQDVGRLVGAGASIEAGWQFLRGMVLSDSDLQVRIAAVVGLADGWQARSVTKGAERASLESALARETDAKVKIAIADFPAQAAKLAAEPGAPVASRALAVTLLGTFGVGRFEETFRELLDPRQPAELQQAVVRALERAGNAAGGALLLDPKNWARYSPQMRATVIVAVTGKAALLEALFDAIERGTLRPTDIPPQKRTQLLKHNTPAIRERAEKVFKALESGDRMAVYRAHRDVLALPADPAKGREIFVRICSACHTRGGIGGKVGPDLTGIRRQPADALLLHILVPNYEVAPQYQAVTVDTRDGRSLTGWISAETDNALTLRTAAGADEVVLRTTIASLTSSGLSLMPDGLEQAMTREELAGLIAFLKSDN